MMTEPVVKQTLRGACMGTAELIPGVGGGNIALILGIYPRLLQAIARVDRAFAGLVVRGQWLAAARHIDLFFVLPLLLGALAALITLSKTLPIDTWLREDPEATYGLFFGLIGASAVYLIHRYRPASVLRWMWFVAGVAFAVTLVSLVPTQTPDHWSFLMLCGFIMATAMLLPGVSGTFVLLALGKYATVVAAISAFDATVLVPVLVGALISFLGLAKGVAWLLAHQEERTMLLVVGMLTGSLVSVWPFQQWTYAWVEGKERLVDAYPVWPLVNDVTTWGGVAMMGVGVLVFAALQRGLQKKGA